MRLNELQREAYDAVREALSAAGCHVERVPHGLKATNDGETKASYRADLRALYLAPDGEDVAKHLRGIPGIDIVWAGPAAPPPKRERPTRPTRRRAARPSQAATAEPLPPVPTPPPAPPEPRPVRRATVNGKPLRESQARYLLRLTGRTWAELPTPPSCEEARELLALLLEALRDRANPDLTTAAVERVRVWYVDFKGGDVRRWPCGKAPRGQGGVRRQTNPRRAAAAGPPPEPDPEPEDDTTRERGEAYVLAAQERLSHITEEVCS